MPALLRRALLIVTLALPATADAQAAAPVHRTDASAVAWVRRLYDAYAWEARDDAPPGRVSLFGAPGAVLRQHLDAGLVQAVLADRACAERTEGICNLDFGPLWASQDPGGATVTVVPTRDPAVVQAHVRHPGEQRARVVTFHLRRTADGWRIRDLGAAEWPSLLALLRRPVE